MLCQQVEPLSLMFLFSFAILLIIQFLAMLYHRVYTLIHVVSYRSTEKEYMPKDIVGASIIKSFTEVTFVRSFGGADGTAAAATAPKPATTAAAAAAATATTTKTTPSPTPEAASSSASSSSASSATELLLLQLWELCGHSQLPPATVLPAILLKDRTGCLDSQSHNSFSADALKWPMAVAGTESRNLDTMQKQNHHNLIQHDRLAVAAAVNLDHIPDDSCTL
ncbi:hypothetical protein EYF80_017393 [Liparis tanakae]|uniref:Uncharacterized protein n=1 Tax=Liparis tanakae TaxID=230148 RepID=A0A4Z2I4Y5_9TELE|nr:hypothetical protein EYF80_017393 [Liparis tanakae]